MNKQEFKKRLEELGYNLNSIDLNEAYRAYKQLEEE